MDEKLCGGESPEIPSVWSLWVSNGTWGSNHMLNRLFGSLVLASGGQSSDPAWPADKGRTMTTIGMRFFSPPMESCVPHRFWEWGPTRVRVQQHLTRVVGNGEHGAHTTCRLPSHPRCPLTSQRDRPPAQGWQDEKGCMGGKSEKKQTWRKVGGLHYWDRQRCKRKKWGNSNVHI